MQVDSLTYADAYHYLQWGNRMTSKLIGFLMVIVGSIACWQAQASPQVVWVGKITYIENAWNGEGIAIHSSSDGPYGCTSDLNDFGITSNDPSYKELAAMALAAFTTNADVELIVDSGNCVFGNRTKVVSIRLKK
ncbi:MULTISPECIES: hypothetical protein [Xanthomonas]|uniref:hypothetical protein n=1 Tax=Xanthomonas TaxID=338 RepID=UPI001ADA12B0|nr:MULTISPECIES: hypothetical protein [unclassified Xanthomonas]MBO9872954.1 hypothetical protein [Xanthomonas sp. D-93]WNH44829.1 hypothetical protein PG878_20390 [Xanthomonas sp. A6251]